MLAADPICNQAKGERRRGKSEEVIEVAEIVLVTVPFVFTHLFIKGFSIFYLFV